MRDHRHLDVWHKAHAFTLSTYRATESFPQTDTFGLVTTMRSGATHLVRKIVEGCGQETDPEYLHCLQQARGVGVELESQLLLAHDLQFLATEAHDELQGQVIEVRRMLSGALKAQALAAV